MAAEPARSRDRAATLVLLHGITDSAACWDAVATALGGSYEVVAPDMRGHGGRPLPDEPVTLTTLAGDVIGVLETTGPAILIGHSLGAATAATVAADRPELVRASILEDPPWLDTPPGSRTGTDHAAWVADLQRLDHAGRLARGRASDPHWSDAELEPWAASKAQVDLRFFDHFDRGSMTGWADLLGRIVAPTLLVTGDPQRGAIVTPEVAARAAELTPSLRSIRIDGAGHSIHRDRLDAYLDHVQAFLREVAS